MAKVSVIVPVYKVEPYLNRCVDSILNQIFSDFELILVDDGSPDNCGAICDIYTKKDPRVHVIHQENGGLSAARNAGIDWAFENSDSQWLTFIDSDDWIHQDYLHKLYTAAEFNGLSVSMCGLYWASSYVEDALLPELDALVLDVESAFASHYDKSVSACCKLVKKQLYENIRFPVGKLYEDAFVTHKLLFACDKIAVVDEKMYYYFYNPTSITRVKWSDRKLDSIEAHELRLEYFRDRGLYRAYRQEQKHYVEELTDKTMHLVKTRESKDAYADSLALLQSKLRLALKQAMRDGAVTWNRETLWSYIFTLKTDVVWKTAIGLQKVYHNLKK